MKGNGPVGRLRELVEAIQARLLRVNETGSLASVMEHEAFEQGGLLADALNELLTAGRDDLPARHSLGWLYWLQSNGLPEPHGQAARDAAISVLKPCFMARAGVLPVPLLPELAERSIPDATAMLQLAASQSREGGSGAFDPRVLEATVTVWTQIATTFNDQLTSHPQRASVLSNLCSALLRRYEFSGLSADLDEAIAAASSAVAVALDDHPDRAFMLAKYGELLRIQAERTGSAAGLDAAVAVAREAVARTPASDQAKRAARQVNLAAALQQRARSFPDRPAAAADLSESIAVAGQAASAAQWPEARIKALANLNGALLLRFERVGDRADLDSAVAVGREAVAAAARSSAAGLEHAVALTNLGVALARRFEHYADARDLEDAVRVTTEAVHDTQAPATIRVRAACIGGRLAAPRDPARGAALLEAAVALLPLLAPRHLTSGDTQDAQHRLGEITGVASDAAAAVLADDSAGPPSARAARALRLLEQGRGVLLGRGFDARGSRAVPEREHPATAELSAAGAEGPVVVFNVTLTSGHALLVTSDGVQALPLPGVTVESVLAQGRIFYPALDETLTDEPASRSGNASRMLNSLEWLWDNVTGPVLDALGIHTTPAAGQPAPRVWWATGGVLGMLPVHAAGYHRDPQTSTKRTVMDRVASSYTPTVRALLHSRVHRDRQRAMPTSNLSSLIVAMPTTPDDDALPGAADEAEALASALPDPLVLIEPGPGDRREPPTKPRVLRELAHRSIAHFACHGGHDAADPGSSRLLLHDHREDPLSVSALAAVDLSHVRLAFLSACDTASGLVSSRLLDESIHLAAAFQLAGFPHVVGTQWVVNDVVALHIARDFYAGLIDPATARLDPDRCAQALRTALLRQRDRHVGMPYLWSSHIHAGA